MINIYQQKIPPKGEEEETRGQSEHEKSRGAGMRTENPNF